MENKQLLSKNATNWFRGIAAVMVVVSHYAEWWAWFTPMEGNAEIFRIALTKLGVYGVDLFFLFSGYAMVKSIGQERMHPEFIWKRIKNVYIPYFIIMGIIELVSGGFTSAKDFGLFASGYDLWYMFVLFIFYIGFIVIWTIMGGRGVRVIAFAIFTYIFSHILYNKGMNDFWYVSNITFALGIIVGEYEEWVKKIVGRIWLPAIGSLTIGMILVVRAGLFAAPPAEPDEWLVWKQVGATLIWTLLIMIIAAKWKAYDKLLILLGKNSLYIYLTHTFIFMTIVNNVEFSYTVRFIISAVITIIVSILCNFILTGFFRLTAGNKKNRKTSNTV